jgi:hypothetical protein
VLWSDGLESWKACDDPIKKSAAEPESGGLRLRSGMPTLASPALWKLPCVLHPWCSFSSLLFLLSRLQLMQLRIRPAILQQLVMAAALDDLPGLQHEDNVGESNR